MKILNTFVVLKKEATDDSTMETVAKIKFDLSETIFDVAKKINESIEDNRKAETKNMVDNLAKLFMSIPLLSRVIIDILKLFDQIGILPKSFLDDIPFHTSLFVTSMASINTGSVFHHVLLFQMRKAGANSLPLILLQYVEEVC